MKSKLFSLFSLLLLGPVAFADMPYWTVTMTCDANLREARIETELCYEQGDGVGTNVEGEACSSDYTPQISDDGRVVSLLAGGNRVLHTGNRAGQDKVSVIGNTASEFSCAMPFAEPSDGPALGLIFMRFERFPSTFNWQGRCGGAPFNASVLIQTGTRQLDTSLPGEKVMLVDNCSMTAEKPALMTRIDADTGEISVERGDPF